MSTAAHLEEVDISTDGASELAWWIASGLLGLSFLIALIRYWAVMCSIDQRKQRQKGIKQFLLLATQIVVITLTLFWLKDFFQDDLTDNMDWKPVEATQVGLQDKLTEIPESTFYFKSNFGESYEDVCVVAWVYPDLSKKTKLGRMFLQDGDRTPTYIYSLTIFQKAQVLIGFFLIALSCVMQSQENLRNIRAELRALRFEDEKSKEAAGFHRMFAFMSLEMAGFASLYNLTGIYMDDCLGSRLSLDMYEMTSFLWLYFFITFGMILFYVLGGSHPCVGYGFSGWLLLSSPFFYFTLSQLGLKFQICIGWFIFTSIPNMLIRRNIF